MGIQKCLISGGKKEQSPLAKEYQSLLFLIRTEGLMQLNLFNMVLSMYCLNFVLCQLVSQIILLYQAYERGSKPVYLDCVSSHIIQDRITKVICTCISCIQCNELMQKIQFGWRKKNPYLHLLQYFIIHV